MERLENIPVCLCNSLNALALSKYAMGGGCNYLKLSNLQRCFLAFSGFLCRIFYCFSVDLLKFLCRIFSSISADLFRRLCSFSALIFTFLGKLFGSFPAFYIFKQTLLLRALSLSVFRNLFFAFRYTGFALCISIFRVFHVVFEGFHCSLRRPLPLLFRFFRRGGAHAPYRQG